MKKEIRMNVGSSCRLVVPKTEVFGTDVAEHALEMIELETLPHLRENGYATALLAKICIECDAEKLAILIHVEPGGETIDPRRLRRFYERHNFRQYQETPLLMVRTPQ